MQHVASYLKIWTKSALVFASNLIKIWSKIDQKILSTSKLVLESVFFRFLVDFGPILDQFWVENGPKNGQNAPARSSQALQKRTSGRRSFKDEFLVDFYPSNDQKCDLASTKCTSMSVLNVENQDFCNAFSNFPTFFQSKRTSRCPKLVPNDYFCSRGDSFSMGLGKVNVLCRNPWNVKKALCF